MAAPRGGASYQKQSGTITISKDRNSVSWTPASSPDHTASLVLAASSITNLQQTPETSAKVMLKIFALAKDQPESVAHVFNFTSSSTARAEANAIKDALTSAIQAAKAAQNAAALRNGGSSAAMAIANAISSGKTGTTWEDDERLKSDVSLQQSLMREDPALQRTFMEARKTKPEAVSNTQFTSQFWSSRVHLLRAHAIAKSQSRGSYNVLSVLKKPEGATKLNLSLEHVHLIFSQYPLMRRVYDEVVPRKLNEHDFWSRFFQSRLYMRLRGERIDEQRDNRDGILDDYLEAEEFSGFSRRLHEVQVPRIIDMEGNEENHSQRKGNRPDPELRPRSHKNVPIIRTLNTLSEKLMAQVAPSDIDPSQPIGMDEATYDSLRLRDLQRDPEQNNLILRVRDQRHFFSEEKNTQKEPVGTSMGRIDPSFAIERLCADLNRTFPQPGTTVLQVGAPETLDDASDEEEGSAPLDVRATASAHIMELIRQHRAQTEEIPVSSGLSVAIYERLTLTHATTSEFLHQFWAAFLSGDPDRVIEVTSLAESLDRAADRIKAVADDAEEERNNIIRKVKKQAADIFERTGKKQRVDYKAIGGGAEVVNQLLGPIMVALSRASLQYQKALTEQAPGEEG